MSPRTLRVVLGIALVAAGVWLVFSPMTVAEALARPHGTSPERINLRATWGGSLLGLGAFVAWLPGVRPYKRFGLGLAMWSMAGIGLARAVGFVLDGGPDALQWIWLAAEAAIAVTCLVLLRRQRT